MVKNLLFQRASHSLKLCSNSQKHPDWAHENRSALNLRDFNIQDTIQEAKFLVGFVFPVVCNAAGFPSHCRFPFANNALS
jgi:hypothetical protein